MRPALGRRCELACALQVTVVPRRMRQLPLLFLHVWTAHNLHFHPGSWPGESWHWHTGKQTLQEQSSTEQCDLCWARKLWWGGQTCYWHPPCASPSPAALPQLSPLRGCPCPLPSCSFLPVPMHGWGLMCVQPCLTPGDGPHTKNGEKQLPWRLLSHIRSAGGGSSLPCLLHCLSP